MLFRWDKKGWRAYDFLSITITTKQEAVILGLEDQNISKPLIETLSFIQAYNTVRVAKLTSLSFHPGWSDLSEGH